MCLKGRVFYANRSSWAILSLPNIVWNHVTSRTNRSDSISSGIACPQRKYGQCKTIHSKLRVTIIREWCPISNIRILSFTSVRIEDNSPLEFFQITSGFFLFENHLASQQKTTSGLSTTIVQTATVQILASKNGVSPLGCNPTSVMDLCDRRW